jgi:hypothetical protein
MRTPQSQTFAAGDSASSATAEKVFALTVVIVQPKRRILTSGNFDAASFSS